MVVIISVSRNYWTSRPHLRRRYQDCNLEMVLVSLSFLSLNIINAFSPTDVNNLGVIRTQNYYIRFVCFCWRTWKQHWNLYFSGMLTPMYASYDPPEVHVFDAGCTLHCALRYKYLQNKESKYWEPNWAEPTHWLTVWVWGVRWRWFPAAAPDNFLAELSQYECILEAAGNQRILSNMHLAGTNWNIVTSRYSAVQVFLSYERRERIPSMWCELPA